MNTSYSTTVKERAFKLREQGLTFTEIGKRMKIPTPTVHSWIRAYSLAHPRLAKKYASQVRKAAK